MPDFNRWSTDAERERVFQPASRKDPAKVRTDLDDLSEIGYLRVDNEVRFALRYARRTPCENARDHITILTDRLSLLQSDSEVLRPAGNNARIHSLIRPAHGGSGSQASRYSTAVVKAINE
jgi:hypothetical protein